MLEYQTFLLVAYGFLGAGLTTIKDGHVSVEMLASRLSLKSQLFLRGVFPLFGSFLFAVISWQCVTRGIAAHHHSEVAEITKIPNLPFYLIASFGCALIALVQLSKWFGTLAQVCRVYDRPSVGIAAILVTAIGVLGAPPLLKLLSVDIDSTTVALLGVALLLVLMFLGFPVAFSMGLVGLLGTWYLAGPQAALGILRMVTYESVAHYFLCVIPFFILMGMICLYAGISNALFRMGRTWFGKLPGGLAITTIVSCAGFASICGDSGATAATMGTIALPEMKKHRYDDALATGCVAAGGTLGILIPPSIGFVVYAIVTQESIGRLFMAGFLPGILLTIIFCLVVYLRCRTNPGIGPGGPGTSFVEKLKSVFYPWKAIFLFVLVVGGIYSGIFTPTEAAGIGVTGSLLVAVFSREFSRKGLLQSLQTTTELTAMIFALLIGVAILGAFTTLTDLPTRFASYITSLQVSRYIILALVLLLYVVLGMLMNIIPMVLLTLPIIFPAIVGLGFDPLWFGVIMVIMMEIGQISPPVGINVFIIHGVAEKVSIGTIYRGIVPFIYGAVLLIVILTIFPKIALWLPSLMKVLPDLR
jgi:tripartite ATP-independent transporter DctM subunit